MKHDAHSVVACAPTKAMHCDVAAPDPKRSHGGRDSAPQSRPLLIGRLTGDGRLAVPWRRVLFANVGETGRTEYSPKHAPGHSGIGSKSRQHIRRFSRRRITTGGGGTEMTTKSRPLSRAFALASALAWPLLVVD